MASESANGRELLAEFVGSLFLTMTIIASGILGMKLSGGDVGLTVLVIALTTGFVLFTMVEIFGSVSGCHINPAVTISVLITKGMSITKGIEYMVAQILGGIFAAVLAHAMYGLPLLTISTVSRGGIGIALGEFIATFGLLIVIFGCIRSGSKLTSLAIGLYVAAGIYFTSSTCFANPQVTIGRIFTDTITGICPADGVTFLVMEVLAAIVATAFYRYVWPTPSE